MYILGGYNDIPFINEVENGIKNCKTLISNKFPNATVHIGMIASQNDSNRTFNFFSIYNTYLSGATNNNCKFITNANVILHDYTNNFSSDGFHPNQYGQEMLAKYLSYYILNNYLNVNLPYRNISIDFEEGITSDEIPNSFGNMLINENVFIDIKDKITFNFSNKIEHWIGSNKNYLLLGKAKNNYLIGNQYRSLTIPCELEIGILGTYYHRTGLIVFLYR